MRLLKTLCLIVLCFAGSLAQAAGIHGGGATGAAPWWGPYANGVSYVSNVANNGYSLGVDTSGCGVTKAAPCLTVDYTIHAMPDNWAAQLNRSGTVYHESTSGTGYLQLVTTNNQTIGSDIAEGQATLESTGSVARVVLLGSSAKTYNLYNLAIDGTGTSSGNLFTQSNTTGALNFHHVNFRNATGSAVIHPTGTGNNLTFDSQTAFESTVHFATSGSGGNYATLTFDNATLANDNQAWHSANGGSIGTLTVTNDTFVTNGAGTGSGFIFAGDNSQTYGTVNFSHNHTTGNFAGPLLNINGSPVISNLIVDDNDGAPSKGLVLINSENIAAGEIKRNVLSVPATSTSGPIESHAVPGVMSVTDNNITVSSTAETHGMNIGGDGYNADATNATATTTQNLGDIAGNAYLGEAFTMLPNTVSVKTSNIAVILSTIKKTGNPTGNITASLYTDNAGVPGTLISNSTTTLAASSLTNAAALYGFQFPDHFKSTPSAVYDEVFHYTGTIDGANYVTFSSNATVTGGSLATSTNGTAWTNNPANALLYSVQTGSFSNTALDVSRNTITGTSGVSATEHCLLIGPTNLTTSNKNVCNGPSIGWLCKNTVDGLVSDNLAYSLGAGQGALYSKGCFGQTFLQNTFISASTTGTTPNAVNFGTNSETGTNAPTSTGTSKNNIVVVTGTGTAYAVDVGSSVAIDHDAVYAAPGTHGIDQSSATWAAWQARGYDANGANVNPQLLAQTTPPTTPTNFQPPSGSPAAAVGTNVQSQVPTDFAGTAFSTTPPAGAYNLGP